MGFLDITTRLVLGVNIVSRLSSHSLWSPRLDYLYIIKWSKISDCLDLHGRRQIPAEKIYLFFVFFSHFSALEKQLFLLWNLARKNNKLWTNLFHMGVFIDFKMDFANFSYILCKNCTPRRIMVKLQYLQTYRFD